LENPHKELTSQKQSAGKKERGPRWPDLGRKKGTKTPKKEKKAGGQSDVMRAKAI